MGESEKWHGNCGKEYRNSPKVLQVEASEKLEIPFKGLKSECWDVGTLMPMAALYTTARLWKQQCSSMNKWLWTMWYMPVMEHYPAFKGRECSHQPAGWPAGYTFTTFEVLMLTEVSQKQKDKTWKAVLTWRHWTNPQKEEGSGGSKADRKSERGLSQQLSHVSSAGQTGARDLWWTVWW